MTRIIEFKIEFGEISSYEADVIALKYAQFFYGADKHIAVKLNEAGISYYDMSPKNGEVVFLDTQKSVSAQYALFVGVKNLWEFGYEEIQEFSKRVLRFILKEALHIKHLAMTIHGVGYGLDEVEALLAQFNGCLQIILEGKVSPSLESISIVEFNKDRVKRLRKGFEKNITGPGNIYIEEDHWAYRLEVPTKQRSMNTRSIERFASAEIAGVKSTAKPHAFVAMPFRKDMEDVFYYGIQSAVHNNGLLCERIDQIAFTGDILARIKNRIEKAIIVIADLTGANPNVYLEVGYAWGKGIPTVLLVKKPDEVCFDIRGNRCLRYEIIKELESSLTKELSELLQNMHK